jgi:hypothetical protein
LWNVDLITWIRERLVAGDTIYFRWVTKPINNRLEAMILESLLIVRLGRSDLGRGRLWNHSNGFEMCPWEKRELSLETKAKHSAAIKAVRLRPKVKSNMSASAKAALARPEVKAKHKAALAIVISACGTGIVIRILNKSEIRACLSDR